MRVAFPVLNNRIAPVFDTARQLVIVDDSSDHDEDETLQLPEELPAQRARRLAESGVKILVCGAVSRQLQHFIQAYGIAVIPFIAGEIPAIQKAYRKGRLDQAEFAMPGCHGRQGQGRRGIGCRRQFRGGNPHPNSGR